MSLERLLNIIKRSVGGRQRKPRAVRLVAGGTLTQYMGRFLSRGRPDFRKKMNRRNLIALGVPIIMRGMRAKAISGGKRWNIRYANQMRTRSIEKDNGVVSDGVSLKRFAAEWKRLTDHEQNKFKAEWERAHKTIDCAEDMPDPDLGITYGWDDKVGTCGMCVDPDRVELMQQVYGYTKLLVSHVDTYGYIWVYVYIFLYVYIYIYIYGYIWKYMDIYIYIWIYIYTYGLVLWIISSDSAMGPWAMPMGPKMAAGSLPVARAPGPRPKGRGPNP